METMAGGGYYAVHRVRGRGRDPRDLIESTEGPTGAQLAAAGGHWWGRFLGLFGVASNELMVVSWMPEAEREVATRLWRDGDTATVVEQHLLVPTVRPVSSAPMTEPGLYVFRFFVVDNASVEEIAALSQQAWTTFETSAEYRAEPKALWCQADRSESRGVMLLVTWYDGFESWETSRQPAPAARENFLRRHRLTHGTVAFATRLLTADQR
jgi:hypothetical protein